MVTNVVKTTKPGKKAPAGGSAPIAATETAQSGYGISKVDRLVRPANDNSKAKTSTTIRRSGLMAINNSKRLQSAKSAPIKEIVGKTMDVATAATAAWTIVGATWILYMVQLVFSLLSLIGMASLITIDDSWLQTLDITGWSSDVVGLMTYIGMGVCGVMGIFTLIIAIMLFILRRVSILRSYSIIVMAVCFALNFAPGASFIPWIWLWCLYVVKSQAD